VTGGKSVIGTVVLESEAAPAVPISITIVKGALSGTFRIKTKPVSTVKSVTITSTANGISKSATLKIKPG